MSPDANLPLGGWPTFTFFVKVGAMVTDDIVFCMQGFRLFLCPTILHAITAPTICVSSLVVVTIDNPTADGGYSTRSSCLLSHTTNSAQ